MNIQKLDDIKRYWLNDAKNLVTSLSKVYGNITLTKLAQQFEAPNIFEKSLLNNNDTLIRKITLSNLHAKLIYARTAIPKNTYDYFRAELDNLGTKPIGDNLLFDKERFDRDEFIIRKLSNIEFETETNQQASSDIYSRSSVFTFKDNSSLKLLITEYFLIIPEVANAN